MHDVSIGGAPQRGRQGPHLRRELPLGILRGPQVLHELLILHCTLQEDGEKALALLSEETQAGPPNPCRSHRASPGSATAWAVTFLPCHSFLATGPTAVSFCSLQRLSGGN